MYGRNTAPIAIYEIGPKVFRQDADTYPSKQTTGKVPNMTRQHFKSIAKVINLIPDDSVRGYIAREMAREISDYNRNFNYDRFIDACGAGKVSA